MLKTYRLGRLLGFPIEVNLTFLLMLGAVLLWMGGLAGVFVVLLAFASVLLHELGHALVARSLNVHVSGIELHFFGGAAKMAEQPRNARDEILIAVAGPAVSFALAGLGWVAFAATGATFFYLFGWINTILGTFNLIPAMPMDGGRVLRALLTRRYSFFKATDIAVKVARGFAIALGLYALFTAQIYLALLAVVVWLMGSAELRAARMFGYRDGGGVRRGGVEVMGPDFDPDAPGAGPHRRAGWDPLVSIFGTPQAPYGAPRPPTRGRRVRLRRVGSRMVVEVID